MPGPALLLVDLQRGFDRPSWGPRNNPGAEDAAARLLDAWRAAGAPLVHVRHASTGTDGVFVPGTDDFEYKPGLAPLPGEAELVKHANSAFVGTTLEDDLHADGIRSLVVAGLTTDHCCSTTARMAANLGFDVTFVEDATATFARRLGGETFEPELVHRVALASLEGEFARVVTAERAIAALGAGSS